MAFKGADAPPHVILHGPSGQRLRHRQRQRPGPGAGLRRAQERPSSTSPRSSSRSPPAGRWTVETAADSSRLVQGIQADGTRPVTATAKVTGSGHDRRLTYTVKGLPAGGRVEFAEAGDGGGGRIGIVKADGGGTLKFHPAGGAPGKREIQAVVYAADGFLAARLTLGTYAAPAPQRPAKAKKLTVRRSGKRLVLRWRGDRAAYTQQVDIRSATGLNLTRTVRRSTHVDRRCPPRARSSSITVTGTTKSGLAGQGRALQGARAGGEEEARQAVTADDRCREGRAISPAPWRLRTLQARAAPRSSAGRASSPCSMRRCAPRPRPRACPWSRSWARRGSARRPCSSTSAPPRRAPARWS